MSRMYKVLFDAVAVTAQQDFFELTGAANKVLKIHRFKFTQSTEVGDAQEEGLHLTEMLGVGSVTAGSGGSTVTPTKQDEGDPAATFTCKGNNTTKMLVGSGTLTQKGTHDWNVRAPYDYAYLPDERPVLAGAVKYALRLMTTPADSITISGEVVVEEIG